MTLRHGKFQFGLSEREVAVLLDALDGAVADPPAGSVFEAPDFAELAAAFAQRTAY